MIKILVLARLICATLGLAPDSVMACWWSPASWAGHGEKYQQACRIDIPPEDEWHGVIVVGYRFDGQFEMSSFLESPLED